MTSHTTLPYHSSGKHSGGFTLVELSIVLVIIGLILGGILVGQDMIRSSQVRSVIADVEAYKSATYMFQDKYGCIPGDCTNATSYWTAAANGDGDGQLDTWPERFGAWQQLALSGMIKGAYSGVTGPTWAYNYVAGENVPVARLPGGIYTIQTIGNPSGDTYMFDGYYGLTIQLGKDHDATYLLDPIVTPEEAYQIDMKMDDGIPGTGNVRTYHSGFRPSCVTGTAAQTTTSSYNISSYNGIACTLMFISGS